MFLSSQVLKPQYKTIFQYTSSKFLDSFNINQIAQAKTLLTSPSHYVFIISPLKESGFRESKTCFAIYGLYHICHLTMTIGFNLNSAVPFISLVRACEQMLFKIVWAETLLKKRLRSGEDDKYFVSLLIIFMSVWDNI